ncbi:hypothetical protein FRC02_011218 [Tulasnella sp. 418]|nr:hypothetical protein FRC02_011218 [Tulasnella sp. 418]
MQKSESYDHAKAARYAAIGAFVASFGAVVVAHCALAKWFSSRYADRSDENHAEAMDLSMVAVYLLSILNAIALFVSLAYLL